MSKNFIIILELGALNNLEQLYLDGSSIDNSFLHKVGVMNSLEVLSVQDCRLNGSLPAQGRWLSQLLHSDIT